MEMMDMAADDTREELRRKLRSNFDGRIVRKDLTKKIKEGANVPVYVLEFLLGQYCSSDDETIIEQGVQNVKRILADNFVRPDEAQKILSHPSKRRKAPTTARTRCPYRCSNPSECNAREAKRFTYYIRCVLASLSKSEN